MPDDQPGKTSQQKACNRILRFPKSRQRLFLWRSFMSATLNLASRLSSARTAIRFSESEDRIVAQSCGCLNQCGVDWQDWLHAPTKTLRLRQLSTGAFMRNKLKLIARAELRPTRLTRVRRCASKCMHSDRFLTSKEIKHAGWRASGSDEGK